MFDEAVINRGACTNIWQEPVLPLRAQQYMYPYSDRFWSSDSLLEVKYVVYCVHTYFKLVSGLWPIPRKCSQTELSTMLEKHTSHDR